MKVKTFVTLYKTQNKKITKISFEFFIFSTVPICKYRLHHVFEKTPFVDPKWKTTKHYVILQAPNFLISLLDVLLSKTNDVIAWLEVFNQILHLYGLLGWNIFNSYVFTNPSTRAGCDTRSIFKQSLTGLNSEFSFEIDCLTKAKNSVCSAIYV